MVEYRTHNFHVTGSSLSNLLVSKLKTYRVLRSLSLLPSRSALDEVGVQVTVRSTVAQSNFNVQRRL